MDEYDVKMPGNNGIVNSAKYLVIVVVGLGSLFAPGALGQEAPLPDRVEFDRDVRPILSDRCFVCHGPDSQRREAELRLDTRDGLFSKLDDGLDAIRPGDLEHSAVYQRISSADVDERMPPADSKLVLSPREIEIIQRWIAQGAVWKQHWSFQPVEPVAVPEVRDSQWPRNPIDRFVLARLEREGLRPTAPAAKERLIRRVSFDLTGLPPTLEEIDAFLADTREDAYERLVDRLLASPHYGERMAVDWLDVVPLCRYLRISVGRVSRDVAVARLGRARPSMTNMPYDQFVTWQLAGDLLPDADPGAGAGHGLQSTSSPDERRGKCGRGVSRGICRRPRDHVRHSHAGTDPGMHALPRSQVRSADAGRVLPAVGFFNSIDESGLYSHFTDAVPTPTLLLMDEPQRATR